MACGLLTPKTDILNSVALHFVISPLYNQSSRCSNPIVCVSNPSAGVIYLFFLNALEDITLLLCYARVLKLILHFMEAVHVLPCSGGLGWDHTEHCIRQRGFCPMYL